MSGRTSTKQLTTGWRPSARRGSSWVETNPTWQTWWGHTAVSIYRLCIHWAWIKTQLEVKYIKCSGLSKSLFLFLFFTLLMFKSSNPFPLSSGCVWCPQSDGGLAGIWWHDGEHQGEKLVQACGESVTQPWGPRLNPKGVVRDRWTPINSSSKSTINCQKGCE